MLLENDQQVGKAIVGSRGEAKAVYIKTLSWGAFSILTVVLALAVGNSVGKLASQGYAEIRQPAIGSKQEFMEQLDKTLSGNELMAIVKRTFPADYLSFLDAVYALHQQGGDLERVKSLGYETARTIRIREGGLALQANEEVILAIFSKKLSTLQSVRRSDSSLCVKYLKGDNETMTLEQIKALGLETESVMTFRAIESGKMAQRNYADLTESDWELIIYGRSETEFDDDELRAISDPKFMKSAPSELVCRSWTKLYEAVGRQELETRVKFMVSMMRDAVRR